MSKVVTTDKVCVDSNAFFNRQSVIVMSSAKEEFKMQMLRYKKDIFTAWSLVLWEVKEGSVRCCEQLELR